MLKHACAACAHTVVSKGWGGLLVEPLPDVFELLQQNYAPYTLRNGLKSVRSFPKLARLLL
eukprot:2084257-Rhodomonas_salina.1